jgi:hypothetical protein
MFDLSLIEPFCFANGLPFNILVVFGEAGQSIEIPKGTEKSLFEYSSNKDFEILIMIPGFLPRKCIIKAQKKVELLKIIVLEK